MLRFENQGILYLLLVILLFIGIYVIVYFVDRSRMRRNIDPVLLKKLMPGRRKLMPHLKFALCMMALACLIVAAANPQTPGKEITADRSGVDVLFCLDVSKSMEAKDVQPSRLEACKMAINHCINRMSGSRVSAVIFAGTAEVALPATTDYEAAKSTINLLTTRKIDIQGTNLAEAMYRSAAALGVPIHDEDADAPDTADVTQKAVILISDGEDHAPDAVAAAQQLNRHGILVFTIGIGTPTGATIPDGNDVKRDNTGRPVVTKLNEQILMDIAEKGGGTYTHADNVHSSFDALFDEIDQMARTDFGKVKLKTYESQFQYPLALGLILLVVEGFLLMGKPRRRLTTLLLLPVIGLLFVQCHKGDGTRENPLLATANGQFARADSIAHEGDPYDLPADADTLYHKALRTYQQVATQYPDFRDQALFNQIDANYRIGNYDSIPHLADSLLQLTTDQKLTADIHYNVGNAHLANGQYLMQSAQAEGNDSLKNLAYNEYGAAIESYKSCLRIHPSDMDAKYNLTYAQKLLPKGQGSGGGGNGQQNQNQQQQGQNGQNQQQQGQNGQDQQQQGQNQQQDKKNQQGQSGQDQQQQRKEEQKQRGNSGKEGQEQQKEKQPQPQEGEKQQNQQPKQQGQGQPRQPKSDEQKTTERQLNALRQNDKNRQKEHYQLTLPQQRQNMEKDW